MSESKVARTYKQIVWGRRELAELLAQPRHFALNQKGVTHVHNKPRP